MGRFWVVFLFWSYVGIFFLVSVSCIENDGEEQIGGEKQIGGVFYACANGISKLGSLGNNDEERCSVCDDGYHLSGRAGAEHTVCEVNAYACANGIPKFGSLVNNGEERCSVCDDGYHLSGVAGAEHTVCEANTYICTNGMPMFGRPRVNEQEGCISCNNRSTLTTTNRCVVHDFTGLMCVWDSDCGGMGLYCDNTTDDNDPKSDQCEPLKGEGETCGKGLNPIHYFSRICEADLQCNGIEGLGSICTTERLGAPCGHNGLHSIGDAANPQNDGLHCKKEYYCDLTDALSRWSSFRGECKVAPSDQGERELTAHELPPLGGTVAGYIYALDVDYFVISVPDKGSLNARLSTMGGSRITLHESILRLGSSNQASKTLLSGGILGSSVSRLLSVPVNRSGTYYIKVNGDPTTLRLGLYEYQLEVFFDRSGDRSDASMITDGSTTSEGLSSSGDIDYFVINVPPSKILRAYTTGSIDTVGRIESDSGMLLVSDNNSGQGNNFDVSYNALAGGTYYIKVTGAADIHKFGNYSLMVTLSSLPDRHGDTLSDATRVIAGSTTQGGLSLGDEDYFVINVPSNKVLRAYITGSTDIIGDVEDSSGTTLVDDYNDNFDLSYTVINAGDYYIWVRKSYGSNNPNIQSYNLQVSVDNAPMINDDHGDTASDATIISMSSAAGSVSMTPGTLHIGDTDYFLLDSPPLTSVLSTCVYTTDASGMMGIHTMVGRSRPSGSLGRNNGEENALTLFYVPGVPRNIAVVGGTSTTTGDYILHVKVGTCP